MYILILRRLLQRRDSGREMPGRLEAPLVLWRLLRQQPVLRRRRLWLLPLLAEALHFQLLSPVFRSLWSLFGTDSDRCACNDLTF